MVTLCMSVEMFAHKGTHTHTHLYAHVYIHLHIHACHVVSLFLFQSFLSMVSEMVSSSSRVDLCPRASH